MGPVFTNGLLTAEPKHSVEYEALQEPFLCPQQALVTVQLFLQRTKTNMEINTFIL
jgi:hypothetical protein